MDKAILSQAANEARGLAIDAVHACSSGHLGLPLGCAEIGAVLFGETLRYNPAVPKWINRDRFILSGGHGSMFLYAWLHLAGYDLSLDELRNFRQMDSLTPGHPEFGMTPGVEATTGPLGQGLGNSVGYALSAKMAMGRYNTAAHTILDHHVVALDQALERLSSVDSRMARTVELRYFAGLSVEETADVLEVASATVKREWSLARAWLRRELGGAEAAPA